MTELTRTARRLLGAARRKPSQADLRRSVSTAYYAGFDALARMCADEVVGRSARSRATAEWSRVYRALNHGPKAAALAESRAAADNGLLAFCATLESLRLARNEADYNPQPLRLKKADVALLIDEMELAIDGLGRVAAEARRAFAFALVVPKRRP